MVTLIKYISYYFRLRNGVEYKKIDFPNENVLFIHIPKAAGMSVVKSIYSKESSHHAKASDYIKINRERYEDMYVFSVVRDPYERLFSAYNYLLQGGMNTIDKYWKDRFIRKYKSFEDFVLRGGLQFAYDNNAEHFIPQYKFICDNESNIIVDRVYKLSELTIAENELSIQLEKKLKFGKLNQSNHDKFDIREHYNADMLEVVNRIYADDFKLLNFAMVI
ncbi:hypothetical protein BCT41_14065 [Vibrio splendidus]|uniref:sulfotransferase family 2 domain-containing protein n=1 Tax=Vibrio splendidus TaxID=29497 RepID=UPI000C82A01D|nr:sulfotransferase family 2 domain-containing protein [Vibrio splendidus]PMM20008.1 hypothetical protein BCT62_00680 [Vibrio splendidus]PMM98508.1 hypothetical protein BCT41_14065 [Vibrio splendidus]PMN33095.1 hypothetical protein BCT36_05915 [Vibrio splendidus]